MFNSKFIYCVLALGSRLHVYCIARNAQRSIYWAGGACATCAGRGEGGAGRSGRRPPVRAATTPHRLPRVSPGAALAPRPSGRLYVRVPRGRLSSLSPVGITIYCYFCSVTDLYRAPKQPIAVQWISVFYGLQCI